MTSYSAPPETQLERPELGSAREDLTTISKPTDRRKAVIVAALAVLVCVLLVPWLVNQGRQHAAVLEPISDLEALKTAYDKTMERTAHFEDMLVTIGTIALAILAGAGGIVFTKEFGGVASDGAGVARAQQQHDCDRIYAGLLTLTVMTTVAYTHVFRYYATTYGLACILEIQLAPHDPRVRVVSSVWEDMSATAYPPTWLTFTFIGMYAAAISVATVFLFGHHFRQSLFRQTLCAVLIAVSALVYVTPAVSRYLSLAHLGARYSRPLSAAPARPASFGALALRPMSAGQTWSAEEVDKYSLLNFGGRGRSS